MSRRLMLDTCICIDLLRGASVSVFEKINQFDPGEVVVSVITHSELLYGAYKSKRTGYNIELIDKLMKSFPILEYKVNASVYYGKIRAELAGKGIVIGANDLLIAAHALAEKCDLGTHNKKEFSRVSGLQLVSF